ncbi:MAG: hypothetical protein OYH77_05660 [Pseudomonadota bacterium]|nr:hypothetical protein [Pseudomonadota bacterium]
MDWRLPFNRLLPSLATALFSLQVYADIKISVSDVSLPRQQDTRQLTVRFTIDDILPSDVALKDGEENIWARLWVTLPDSDADSRELPLPHYESPVQAREHANEQDSTPNVSHHRDYYFVPVDREVEEEPNINGNTTVYYEIAIRAYEDNLNALYDDSGKLKVRIAYRVWGVDSYGGLLAAITHEFIRIDGVPSVAPKLTGVTALHHRLQVEMQRENVVEFTNSQGKQPVRGVVAYVLAKSTEPVSLVSIAKVFRPVAAGGDTDLPADAECQWLPDCSISCPTPNVYLAYDEVGKIPALSNSTLLSGRSDSIPDLKPGVVYQIMLQHYPDGIARSVCMEAAAIENKTLLELNDLGEAKRHDLHCFIATAAYGSDAVIVKQLRWFRDRFLLPYASGRKLVALYYEHSPALATHISSNALLKVLAQALLLLPLAMVMLLKYPLIALLLLLAMFLCRTKRTVA